MVGSSGEDQKEWQFVYGILSDCLGLDPVLSRGSMALDRQGKMVGLVMELELDEEGQVVRGVDYNDVALYHIK